MNEKKSHGRSSNEWNKLSLLFTDDKEIARNALMQSSLKTGQKLHWMLNMGHYNTVKEIIMKRGAELGIQERMGIEYRLANKVGNQNPYRTALSPTDKMSEYLETKAKKEGVVVDGGLGDILEGISRIYGKSRESESSFKIYLMENKYEIFKRITNIDGLVFENT